MPTYRITSKATGETRLYYGSKPPTEEQADQFFASPMISAREQSPEVDQAALEAQANEPTPGTGEWDLLYGGPTSPPGSLDRLKKLVQAASIPLTPMLGGGPGLAEPTTAGLLSALGSTVGGAGGAYAGHKLVGGNTGTILGLLAGALGGGKGASMLAGLKGLQPGLFETAPIASAAETLPGKFEAFLEAAGSKTHPGLYGTIAKGLAGVLKRGRESKLAGEVTAGVKRLPPEEAPAASAATALPQEAPFIPNVTVKAGQAGAELPSGVTEEAISLLMKQLKIPRERAIEIAQANAPGGGAPAAEVTGAGATKPSGLTDAQKAQLDELVAATAKRAGFGGRSAGATIPEPPVAAGGQPAPADPLEALVEERIGRDAAARAAVSAVPPAKVMPAPPPAAQSLPAQFKQLTAPAPATATVPEKTIEEFFRAASSRQPTALDIAATELAPTGRMVKPFAPPLAEIKPVPLASRAFKSWGYSRKNLVLQVEHIDGSTYQYPGVQPEEVAAVKGAESKGAAIGDIIRKRSDLAVRIQPAGTPKAVRAQPKPEVALPTPPASAESKPATQAPSTQTPSPGADKLTEILGQLKAKLGAAQKAGSIDKFGRPILERDPTTKIPLVTGKLLTKEVLGKGGTDVVVRLQKIAAQPGGRKLVGDELAKLYPGNDRIQANIKTLVFGPE